MHVAHGGTLPRWLRPVCWGVIALSLGLIALHVLLYPPLLAMPDGWSFVLAPVVILALYAGVVLALPAVSRISSGIDALQVGTHVGLVAAAIEALNISLESLVAMPQTVTTLATGIFMIATFALWETASFLGAYRSQRIVSGVLAALWAAMVTMLLAVTYGFALLVVAMPRLAAFEASDPDFSRSHWTDLHAFTIANTLSHGATHLIEAPIVALVIGGIGAGVGRLVAQYREAKAVAS
jgi:type IV secretory pathway TrbD component